MAIKKAGLGKGLDSLITNKVAPVKVETTRKFCFQRHIALLKPLIDRNG